MIPVTKPFIPPLDKYTEYLEGIWDRNWLTNNGPLVMGLESKLCDYLDVEHLLFLGNGTIAIQIAIKALKLEGQIITTPFSYVATTSSIVWENCIARFVDIDPNTFNINADLIEEQITDETSAILCTHVFGNPCHIDKIEAIANKHNLKVIYDAAHCFGTTYKGRSVMEYGTISTTSFHATKLFHTIEGGAVVTKDESLYNTMKHLRNFGHDGPFRFSGVGINGKNSEVHAAMGHCNLKYIESILKSRAKQYKYYLELFEGSNVRFQRIEAPHEYNHAYFPVVFESESILLRVIDKLNENDIFPRRYFYPSLNQLEYVEQVQLPEAESIASRILCLPVYHYLEAKSQEKVVKLIKSII